MLRRVQKKRWNFLLDDFREDDTTTNMLPFVEATRLLQDGDFGRRERGLRAMIQYAAHERYELFDDGVAISLLIGLFGDVTFESRLPILFFLVASYAPESILLKFVSPSFLDMLRCIFLNGNVQKSQDCLMIFGNLVEGSEFLADKIVNEHFVDEVIQRCLDDIGNFYIPLSDFIKSIVQRSHIIRKSAILTDSLLTIISSMLALPTCAWKVGVNVLAVVSAVQDEIFICRCISHERIGFLVNLLCSSEREIREDALTALVNFSRIGPSVQAMILDAGLRVFSQEDVFLQFPSAFTRMALNYLYSEHTPAIQFLNSPGMKWLVDNIDKLEFESKEELCRALCYVFQRTDDCELFTAAIVYAERCIPHFAELLSSSESGLIIEIVRAIDAILSSTAKAESHNIVTIIHDFVPISLLYNLLSSDELPSKIKIEVEAVINNLSTRNYLV